MLRWLDGDLPPRYLGGDADSNLAHGEPFVFSSHSNLPVFALYGVSHVLEPHKRSTLVARVAATTMTAGKGDQAKTMDIIGKQPLRPASPEEVVRLLRFQLEAASCCRSHPGRRA